MGDWGVPGARWLIGVRDWCPSGEPGRAGRARTVDSPREWWPLGTAPSLSHSLALHIGLSRTVCLLAETMTALFALPGAAHLSRSDPQRGSRAARDFSF